MYIDDGCVQAKKKICNKFKTKNQFLTFSALNFHFFFFVNDRKQLFFSILCRQWFDSGSFYFLHFRLV